MKDQLTNNWTKTNIKMAWQIPSHGFLMPCNESSVGVRKNVDSCTIDVIYTLFKTEIFTFSCRAKSVSSHPVWSGRTSSIAHRGCKCCLFPIDLGSLGSQTLRLQRTNCMKPYSVDFFYILKQVPICFSCLRKRCVIVLLRSSRNVPWIFKTSPDSPLVWSWVDYGWINFQFKCV